jgi:hypothetical protein
MSMPLRSDNHWEFQWNGGMDFFVFRDKISMLLRNFAMPT